MGLLDQANERSTDYRPAGEEAPGLPAREVNNVPWSPARFDELAHQLRVLRDEMHERRAAAATVLSKVHPAHRRSAENLIDYLTLRGHDLRPLQRSLAECGLSSLGRAEEHVSTAVDTVLWALGRLSGHETGVQPGGDVSISEGERILEQNTTSLLGPPQGGRATRILVTMPSEAAADPKLVAELLRRGMDCARVNCAHDDPAAWAAMVRHIRDRSSKLGRSCPVIMDLPGPKLRTGSVRRGAPGEGGPTTLDGPAVADHDRAVRVYLGDLLTLHAGREVPAGGPAGGGDRSPSVHVGCNVAIAVDALRVGHRVWLDDGKFGGAVVARRSGEADVVVTHAPPGGAKLRPGRGINVPDTRLALAPISEEDGPTLELIARNADAVALSFAQRPSDVLELRRRLEALGAGQLGLVLKIETAEGFNRLPELLLAAMASARVGVMVARGDLAVECGYERLAEVQEEMLWLCDAAHLPVIWATQVLDRMARTGQPSRPEVSDAAMSGRAECVMLNKGPFIGEAVSTLDDILRRMAAHQQKKVALLRRLQSWSPEAATRW